MHIKALHTLEVLRFKRKTILCQIKIIPRNIVYYHGQTRPHKSYRWMQAENWAKFDEGLETILAKCSETANWEFKEEEEEFKLDGLIFVRVKRSRIPVEMFCHSLSDVELTKRDIKLCLECIIEHKENGKWGTKQENILDDFNLCNAEEDFEYKPEHVSAQTDAQTGSSSNSFSYVPYTPSPTTGKTNALKDIINSGYVEEQYSPKAINDSNTYTISESSQPIPEYCPKRIQSIDVDENQSQKLDVNGPVGKKNGKTVELASGVQNSNRQKKEKNLKAEEILKKTSKSDEINIEENLIDDNKICKGKSKKMDRIDTAVAATHASKIDKNIQLVGKLRRSSRSPVKTSRLIEKMSSIDKPAAKEIANHKTQKTILKHSDLFGSEEDEHSDSTTDKTRTVVSPTLTNQIEVMKKRRKRIHSDCTAEKQTMNTWLSKQPPPNKPQHSTSTQQSNESGLKKKTKKQNPTKNHDGKLQTENLKLNNKHKLKQMLDNVKEPLPPEKVENMCLRNMTIEEIEGTFLQFKPMLDQIFEKYCKKSFVKGHNGINHYLVMNLLDNTKQLEMMHKLRDVYETNCDGSSLYVSHFSNGMMPEWILGIFMEKYNFSRDKAIEQLQAQEAYRQYLEAQSNSDYT